MNANELADKLKLVRYFLSLVDGQVLNDAEAVLRQQQAEIEALKKSINEALASIPAYGEQGFYFEHHDINGEYLGHSSIHAEDVVQRIEAILRKASEK